MKKVGLLLFIIVFFALLAVLILTLPAPAMSWYDYQCCSERDCRQTTLGEVERHDNGWYVVPLKLTVPFNDVRLRRSRDPLIHICLIFGGVQAGRTPTLRCLYVPEVAG